MTREKALAELTARALTQVLGDLARSASVAARLQQGNRSIALQRLAQRLAQARERADGAPNTPDAAEAREDEASASTEEHHGV